MGRASNRILVVIFLGMVSLPLAATLAGVEGADPTAENRELTKLPVLDGTWTTAAGYLAAFGHWFDDHYAFRSRLIRWDATVRMFALGASPSRTVLVGRDSWLFYADDGASEDIARFPALTTDELATWHKTITRARDWLRDRRIAFVFTVAPDKHVVYREELPAGVQSIASESRTDQLLTELAESGVAVDLRGALFGAKEHERLYHLTDTHWNDRGAHVAYQEIIEALRHQDPMIPPAWPISDFELTTRTADAGDLGGMLGLKRVLKEERLLLVPKRPRRARVIEPPGGLPTDEAGRLVTEIPGSALPRAVIFRDSFVSPLVPFLSEHFSRAVYLWQKDFVPEQVTDERPDVVIYEIVGRHLHNFTPSPELIPK